MSIAPPEVPVIERLSQSAVEDSDRYPTYQEQRRAVDIPDWMLGEYNLPRGSVFVAVQECREPYLFSTNVQGETYDGRAYMVVADTFSTLAYPVYVRQQRAMVVADVLLQARDIFSDVMPHYWWAGVRKTPARR